jgi:hypothetical protein
MQWRTKKSATADENGSATKPSHEDDNAPTKACDALKAEGSASFIKALWNRKSSRRDLVSQSTFIISAACGI